MEKKKEEIDVFDFNNTIAEFLRDGLLKYVEEKRWHFLPRLHLHSLAVKKMPPWKNEWRSGIRLLNGLL